MLPHRLAVHREGLWGLTIGSFLNGEKSSPFHGKVISPSLSTIMDLKSPSLSTSMDLGSPSLSTSMGQRSPSLSTRMDHDLHPCLRAWRKISLFHLFSSLSRNLIPSNQYFCTRSLDPLRRSPFTECSPKKVSYQEAHESDREIYRS